MGDYNKIEIQVETPEQSDILIAELSDMKFYAFEEEHNMLTAYISKEDFNESELKNILSEKNIYKIIPVENTNWNAKWESEFEPVIVNDFVAVRASFHQPIKSVMHEIIITPKMSFGTAHHPTTFIMLQEMKKIDFKNKTVLDFGTGTGILAILAKKLGAKKVTAIDNDEWSITNAEENFSANDITDIELLKKDNLTGLGTYDIILANINLNIILLNIDQIKLASRETLLLLSGFLKKDEQKIIENFTAKGFGFEKTNEKEDWICILLTNTDI